MDTTDYLKEIGLVGKSATRGQFVLGQNYPNPFKNTTAISFSLLEPSFVWLDVYNTRGRKIAQVIKKGLTAGEHVIEWSRLWLGEVLPAGHYAYQLNVENSKGLHTYVKVMTVI